MIAGRRPPEKLAETIDAVGHLKSTLRKQMRTAGLSHGMIELICKLLRHWIDENLSGRRTISPSNDDMKRLTKLEKRQVQVLCRRLEFYEILVVLKRGSGRGHTSEYEVDIDAIIRLPSVNLGKRLIEKLRNLKRFEVERSKHADLALLDGGAVIDFPKKGAQKGCSKGCSDCTLCDPQSSEKKGHFSEFYI